MGKSHLRKNRINFVLTDKELRILQENADKAQLTVSEYIRHATIYKEEKQMFFNSSDLESIRIGGVELHRGDKLKVTKDYGFYGEDSYITVDFKNGNWCLKDNENVLLGKYLENHQADEEVSFRIISTEVK